MAEVDAAARAQFWRQANPAVTREAAEAMFGEPNVHLCTKSELRFGRKGSVSVALTGERAGQWFDHEKGEGGLLPVPDDEFRKLAGMRGLLTSRPAQRPPAPDAKPSPADLERETTAILAAQRIWRQTQPLSGTLADHYLRRIRRRDPTGCADLRFHAGLNHEGRMLPTLVAGMRCVRSGRVVGIHRTYLDPTTGAKVARKMRGRTREAGIMLDSHDAPVHGLGVCEGAEDGLAARLLYRPVWCLASAGAVAKFPVLPEIHTLLVFADTDAAGQRAVAECSARWTAAGAEVVMVGPRGYKDIDEALP